MTGYLQWRMFLEKININQRFIKLTHCTKTTFFFNEVEDIYLQADHAFNST